MSVWKEIRCDVNGPKCYSERNDGPMGFDTPGAMRREGKRQGWRYINGRDICPNCAKDVQQ